MTPCDAWVGLNGMRVACQLELGHEGLHTCSFIGRTEHAKTRKEVKRIDGAITWSNDQPIMQLVKEEGEV